MRLRTTTILFGLLTILMVLPGLYIYYISSKAAALNEDRIVSQSHLNSINDSITQLISRYSKISLSLSRHREIYSALIDPSDANLEDANHVLDTCNATMETDVCYLLNSKGITIASSNRHEADSFIGKDYSFRPYFTRSIQGVPHVYLASGITSGRRGIYLSSPVFQQESGAVIGVCVIKENVEKIENEIITAHYPTHIEHQDVICIINENAVIFMSDKKNMLFKTLWKTDKSRDEQIGGSKQFGEGPWPWAGYKLTKEKMVVDSNGRNYHFLSAPIHAIPEWKIVHFSDADTVSERILSSFQKTAGYLLCFVFIIVIFFFSLVKYLSAKAEKELALSEEKYRYVTDSVNEGIVLKAASGEILTWNRGAEKIMGITAGEVVGQKAEDKAWPLIREDGSPYESDELPSVETLATGKPVRNKVMSVSKPDNELRWISVNTYPLFEKNGNKPYAVAISFSDITDLKKEKEALKNERDLVEHIMETSPAGISRTTADGQIVYINRRAEEILGLEPSDDINRNFNDPKWKITDFSGNPFPGEKLPFNLVKRTGRAVYDIHHAIEWPDGRLIFLSINASPLFDASGEFDGMVATVEDITEKYKTEQNYQMIFREMFDGFALHEILCDDSGNPVDYRFLAVNPAFERLTGLTAGDVIGKTVLEIMPDTEKSWIDRYGSVALTGEPITFEDFSRELDRYYQVTAFRPTKNQFACIIMDTTDRKSMEKRLLQAQKMESIGSLAGGIAHDFNNILFPIIGISELMMEDLPKDSIEYGNAKQILKAGKRGGDLVKQILAFSRQSEYQTMPIRIQQVLKEVLKLSRSTIPADIEITKDIQPDCGMVLANATQIHQVAMNLITNAFHAIEPRSGKINIQLKEMELVPSDVSDTHLTPGPYVRLSISDTGSGIPPDLLDKIFDPYFTTKEQGKGTGLGLAIVYGIIKDYHGDIRVTSQAGGGTTFHIFFPLIDDNTEEKIDLTADIIQTGTERILLVDDEEPIARLQATMLDRLGYKVSQRTSSMEALKAFQAGPDNYDLVITDMAMPNMTGDRLAHEILSIRKDIPIIICTGYSERFNKDQAEKIGVKGFLMKPVVRSELARMVREVLDKNQAENKD